MYACVVVGDGGAKITKIGGPPPPKGGKRGIVAGFSDASRRRLIDRLMMVPWASYQAQGPSSATARACLVTLTYPREYPDDWEVVKRHLDNFRRALTRAGNLKVTALWRMEYQRRGAPHFHILMFTSRQIRITAMRDWALLQWYRIVGSGDERHRRRGVDVRPVTPGRNSQCKLMVYLIKYLGKLDDMPKHRGRCWGQWGQIPQAYRVAATFRSAQGYHQFIRRVRRWGKQSKYLACLRSPRGLRVYRLTPAAFMSIIRELPDVDVYTLF